MLGGYRLTSITILKMLGGDTWSMFQFHHVPCSMFKSMFKYDEEMLCFLVQITSFTPNSPRFTHIVNPAAIHQIKLYSNIQPRIITFLHKVLREGNLLGGVGY